MIAPFHRGPRVRAIADTAGEAVGRVLTHAHTYRRVDGVFRIVAQVDNGVGEVRLALDGGLQCLQAVGGVILAHAQWIDVGDDAARIARQTLYIQWPQRVGWAAVIGNGQIRLVLARIHTRLRRRLLGRVITLALQRSQAVVLGLVPAGLAERHLLLQAPGLLQFFDALGVLRDRAVEIQRHAVDGGAQAGLDLHTHDTVIRRPLHAGSGLGHEVTLGGCQLGDLVADGLHHVLQLVVGDVLAILVARQIKMALQQVADGLGRLDLDVVLGTGRCARERQGDAGREHSGIGSRKTKARRS